MRLAESFASADDGLRVSQSARNIVAAGLEEDIAYCAQESIHAIVPRLKGTVGTGVEVTL
jgi:phosphosulfolactate phosphohydrolase-like enzyme